jgi:hypothetical protein
MEALIPGSHRIGFEELTRASSNAIAMLVYEKGQQRAGSSD